MPTCVIYINHNINFFFVTINRCYNCVELKISNNLAFTTLVSRTLLGIIKYGSVQFHKKLMQLKLNVFWDFNTMKCHISCF